MNYDKSAYVMMGSGVAAIALLAYYNYQLSQKLELLSSNQEIRTQEIALLKIEIESLKNNQTNSIIELNKKLELLSSNRELQIQEIELLKTEIESLKQNQQKVTEFDINLKSQKEEMNNKLESIKSNLNCSFNILDEVSKIVIKHDLKLDLQELFNTGLRRVLFRSELLQDNINPDELKIVEEASYLRISRHADENKDVLDKKCSFMQKEGVDDLLPTSSKYIKSLLPKAVSFVGDVDTDDYELTSSGDGISDNSSSLE